MATNTPTPVGSDTLIAVKVSFNGSNKKFKLPLADLTPSSLIPKLRLILGIPLDRAVTCERFSDSNASYMSLHPALQSNYKSLQRAAKAKLKLKLRLKYTEEPDLPLYLSDPVLPARLSLRQKQSPNTPSELPSGPLFSASEATLNSPTGGVRVSAPALIPGVEPASESITPASLGIAARSREQRIVPQAPAVARDEPTNKANTDFFNDIARAHREHAHDVSVRANQSPTPAPVPQCPAWSVYCNICEAPIPDVHYHCNTCDDGDYDLCPRCIADGKHCKDDEHFLIKRTVENGQVVGGTTQRLSYRVPTLEAKASSVTVKAEPEEKKMPGTFTEEKKAELEPELDETPGPTRTCNSCVKVFPEASFLHCQTCEDFDLCVPCLTANKHGHHPGHAFKAAVEGTSIGPYAEFVAAAGRNVRHAAICDGCNVNIYGVRHKCMNCPDWDYCAKCIGQAAVKHSGHRFAAIFEPLPETIPHAPRHCGVFCDGPLCANSTKSYIHGVRYKCAICPNLDFCGNCEASPDNKHNRTHPLIKFKTPVKNVSVTTLGEDKQGLIRRTMGDNAPKRAPRPHSVAFANGLSKVEPILDVKPAEELPAKPVKEKIEIKDLLTSEDPTDEQLKAKIESFLAQPKEEEARMQDPLDAPAAPKNGLAQLQAHFIRETVPDGTNVVAGMPFTQTWTMANPGPTAWPAGCAVCFVGGDNLMDQSGSATARATSNVISHQVGVGEEVDFKVALKSDLREGTRISYFRLTTAKGFAFGHRLWCDVEVVSRPSPNVKEVVRTVLTGPSERVAVEEQGESSKAVETAQKSSVLETNMEERRRAAEEAQIKASKQLQERLEIAEEARKAELAEERAGRARARKLAAEQKSIKERRELRALHAARLAALIANKKELAASIDKATAGPSMFQATVEDADEKEQAPTPVQGGPAYPARDIRSYMPTVPQGPRAAALSDLSLTQREAVCRQIEARRFGRKAQALKAREKAGDNEECSEQQQQRQQKQAKQAKQRRPETMAEALKLPLESLKAIVEEEEKEVAQLSIAWGAAQAAREARAKLEAERVGKPGPEIKPEPEIKTEAETKPEAEIKVKPEPVEQKSTMIFPKLDKESPASSTHEAVSTVGPPSPAMTTPVAVGSPRTEGAEALFDDAESVELVDASSNDSEDGFLTDEEYDFLHASDEELV